MSTQNELNKIFELWSNYFNKEFDFIKLQEQNLSPSGFGDYMMFEVEKFNEKKWKSEVRLKLKQERKDRNSFYYVDYNGLPVREEHYDYKKKLSQTIYYQYTSGMIVMVSYSPKSHFPDFVRVLELNNNRKVAFYSISINGGAFYLRSKSLSNAVLELSRDNNSFWWGTHYFVYSLANRIEQEACFWNHPGAGFGQGIKMYEYDEKNLKKIFMKWASGYTQVYYYRKPANFTIKGFLEYLANLFYDKLIDSIKKLELKETIGMLQIFYQSVSNYWPLISYTTTTELASFESSEPGTDFFYAAVTSDDRITIDRNDDLIEQFSILEQLTEANHRPHYGERMWSIVVKKLNAHKSEFNFLDPEFFAFASGDLDYNIKSVLKSSGATKEQMKAWNKKGYI